MDGDKEPLSHDCDVVQLKVKGDDASDVIITASAVPSICPPPHSQAIKFYKNEYAHLEGLKLADEIVETPFRGDEIDIMIGLDFYYSFLFDET